MKLVKEMPRFKVICYQQFLEIRWLESVDGRFDDAVRAHVNEKCLQHARRAGSMLEDEVTHVIKSHLAELMALERLFIGVEGVAMAKFELGQITATPAVLEALGKNGQAAATFLARHHAGDFGEIDDEDTAGNIRAQEEPFGRILSSYALKDGTRIWVLTEEDRSLTTVLLPEEG